MGHSPGMKILALFSLSLAVTSYADDGWVDLFDGKTTEGWTPRAAVISFEAKICIRTTFSIVLR